MKKIIQGLLLLLILTSTALSFAEEVKVSAFVPKSTSPLGIPIPKTGKMALYLPYLDDGFYQMGNPIKPRFTDNGNGTVTDNATGLMWEQKTKDSASIHYYLDMYNWLNTFTFINNLNNVAFAGYTDWRLPNISELQSIVNYDVYKPAIYLIFNTLPYITVSLEKAPRSRYWSSTTWHNDSTVLAWGIDFFDGSVYGTKKTLADYVRAVRGPD